MAQQTPISKPSRLAVEYLARTSLAPNRKNAGRHSSKRIAKLTSSIRNFGFNGAILSNESGEITAGPARRQHVSGKTALLAADGRAFHHVQSHRSPSAHAVNDDLKQER